MTTVHKFTSPLPPRDKLWMGIDPSLTAFAISIIDEEGSYQIAVLKPATRGAERLKEIYAYLGRTIADVQPVDVAMEGTVVRSASASVLGELAGISKLALLQCGYEPLIVPPLTLKKFVIGTAAQQQKSHMMMAALKRYKVEIPDDNAVDAYGLSRIARGEAISKIEEQVLAKLKDPKFRE